MSKISNLKIQYPDLNLTLVDLISKIDNSNTNKFAPLFCKITNSLFTEIKTKRMDFVKENLSRKNITFSGMNDTEIIYLEFFSDFFPSELFPLFKEFEYFIDKRLVKNLDITSYKNLDEVKNAVSLATIKENEKFLEKQIILEYEDNTWLAVRPLTFQSSIKYGAATKWCTTYKKDKHHFERYWREGVLVYFINKITGYKFAGYKCLSDDDLSFWSDDDSRKDFLQLDIEEYMLAIVRKIFKSKDSNKKLCNHELQLEVHEECLMDDSVQRDILNELRILPINVPSV